MRSRCVLTVLFFGSLWGMWEAIVGDYLHSHHIPNSSIYLSVGAFFFLALARGYLNRRGSSTAIGSIAMLYKIFNSPFYACHLWAIFLLGASFDITASLLLKEDAPFPKQALTGVLGVYLGFSLFAFSITCIFRYYWWIQAGLPRIFHYITYNATAVAVASAVLVPLGTWTGRTVGTLSSVRGKVPAYVHPLMGGLTVLWWLLGFLRA